jgi:hypothetical protein
MGSVYAGFMIDRRHMLPFVSRVVTTAPRSGLALGVAMGLVMGLGGCANLSDGAMNAFADPAKYDSFDCKQLQDARKALAVRAAELQGLMAKAETGVAGPVVAEVAYRNDYISTRASSKLADEVWQRNNCVAVPDKPTDTSAIPAAPAPRGKGKGANSPLIR